MGPEHQYGMKEVLEWKLMVYGGDFSDQVKSLLEDFFLSGVLWAESKLELPPAFYEWLDDKAKNG